MGKGSAARHARYVDENSATVEIFLFTSVYIQTKGHTNANFATVDLNNSVM